MADFLRDLNHYFGSRNLYKALGVANDATGYFQSISKVESSGFSDFKPLKVDE